MIITPSFAVTTYRYLMRHLPDFNSFRSPEKSFFGFARTMYNVIGIYAHEPYRVTMKHQVVLYSLFTDCVYRVLNICLS